VHKKKRGRQSGVSKSMSEKKDEEYEDKTNEEENIKEKTRVQPKRRNK
jgi:hypothetical protein